MKNSTDYSINLNDRERGFRLGSISNRGVDCIELLDKES